jgi:hypothetical protein
MCLPEYESQNLKHTLMLWVVFFCEFFHFVGKKKRAQQHGQTLFWKKIKNFTRFLGRYLWNCQKKALATQMPWLPIYLPTSVTYLSTHLGYQPTLHNCMYLYILSRAVLFIGRLFLRLKSFCGKWNTHYHWAKGVVKGSRLATIFSSLWSETNVWMFCTAEQVPHCPYWCVRPTGAGYQCKSNWKLSHTMKEISTHESTIR